jgi:hypothetical protein
MLAAMRAYYQPHGSVLLKRDELNVRDQGSDEPIEQFCVEQRKLIDQVNPNMPADEKLAYLLRAIRPELREAILNGRYKRILANTY